MTPWLAAAIALLPALAVPVWVAASGSLPVRLAAVQCATGITALIIILFSFAFDEPSLPDLALALGFLAVPGTLLLALFTERWL